MAAGAGGAVRRTHALRNNSGPGRNYTDRVEGLIFSMTLRNRLRRDPKMKIRRAPKLDYVARGHSLDMAKRGFFSHTNPDGNDPADRGDRIGFDSSRRHFYGDKPGLLARILGFEQAYTCTAGLGENIVKCHVGGMSEYDSAKLCVTSWMKSPGHRANILNDRYKEIGVGVRVSAGGWLYATQNFC